MHAREALLLGISLILAAATFGMFHYASRLQDEAITVVGTATQRAASDIVKWRITVSRSVGLDDLANGYVLIDEDRQAVAKALASHGIADEDIPSSRPAR